MYISQVKLRNFRNFRSLDLDFSPGKNVIAGKNNSGKSNIIRAINYVLGERYPTYIDVEPTDFHATCSPNSDEPQYASSFTIYVQLMKCGDLDYNEEELLKYKRKMGYVRIDDKPIFDKKTQDIDESYLYSEEKYSSSSPMNQKGWDYAKVISSMIKEADSVSVYLHVKKEKDTGELIKYYGIILSIKEHNYLIFTINNNLRECLITSAIIQAIRSPNNDLRINNYSWYSKMLKKHWNLHDTEKLNKLNQELQKEAGDKLNSVTSEISDEVSRATNVESVKFNLVANNINELYKSAKIYVNDANFETTLENMGTGTQSHIIISLFARYCQTTYKSGTLLAIEEPECYLHPHARRALSSFLDSFVQNDAKDTKPKNQIILTTHSIEFLKDVPLENIHILRKGESKALSIPEDDPSINGYKPKIRVIINLDAEIFFADCVILVEGGEKHLLPLIAYLLRKEGQTANPLDQNNISVVGVGGKSKFDGYISLLKSLDIPYYIIADLDMLDGKELNKIIKNTVLKDLVKKIKENKGETPAVMDKLHGEHIYILPKGELEDYYLDKAKKMMPAKNGKEVIARSIADEVWAEIYTTHNNTIEEYLDVSEYKDVIQRAIQDCQNRRETQKAKAVMTAVYECWNAGGSSGGKKNDKWYFETRKHSGRLEINPEAMTEEQALKEMGRGKNIMTVKDVLVQRLINRFNGDPLEKTINLKKHHGGKEEFFDHENFMAKNQRCHVWLWRP